MVGRDLYTFFTICLIVRISQAEVIIDRLTLIEKFLGDELPKLIGQKPNSKNGLNLKFKKYALHDESNEDVGLSTEQELITRSGFEYENHYVLSDDGYITQCIRVINPKADKSKLKQPPVVLNHGSLTSISSFLWASPIQHYPESYPKLSTNVKQRSWNRSLPFMLANNGYDVWLLPTRGSNRQSSGHLKYKVYQPPSFACVGKDSEKAREAADLKSTFKYWDYSMDELVQFELPRQLDKVLKVTGASKISFISYALGNLKSIPLIVSRPEYAEKIHTFVMIAPFISSKGANKLVKDLYKTLAHLNYDLGTAFVSEVLCTRPTQDVVLALGKSRRVRYSTLKNFMTLIFGSSAKYNTLLDSAVLGHIFQGSGFKELQHYSQQVLASKMQKFDHGPIANKLIYGQIKTPVYDLSKFKVKKLLLISGANDNLSTPESVKIVLQSISSKPLQHIVVPDFNHVDLIAGFENDIYVNLPILEFLDHFKLKSIGQTKADSYVEKEQKILEKFVPKELTCD